MARKDRHSGKRAQRSVDLEGVSRRVGQPRAVGVDEEDVAVVVVVVAEGTFDPFLEHQQDYFAVAFAVAFVVAFVVVAAVVDGEATGMDAATESFALADVSDGMGI